MRLNYGSDVQDNNYMIRALANLEELFLKALRLFNKMIAAWNSVDY